MPNCQTVDMSFLDTAKEKVINVVEVEATPEAIFAEFEDPDSWPKWFEGIKKVTWTTDKPYGVGTTRTVQVGPIKVWEEFILWEDNKRFAFFFTKTSTPFVKALLEDYKLEKIDDKMTRFTYTVAYNPSLMLALSGPIGKAALRKNFSKASESFVKYMKNK